MKRWLLCAVVSVLAMTVAGTEVGADDIDPEPTRPNILVILVDDLGYGDLGSYGHPTIRTPYIDQLASEGVRLTEFYSAAPVCSPARAAFLTGRIPARTGVYDWIPPGSDMHLPVVETTVAELLQGVGYQTAVFGKWHLNGGLMSSQPQPDDHGFQHWYATAGFATPTHRNPFNFAADGEELGPLVGYACQLVAGEAIRWLREDWDSSKPFFQFVSFHEPHEAIESPPVLVAGYPAAQNRDEAQYFANVENLDLAVGWLLATLDELGLTKNTFVLFTSDNGPEMLNRHPQAQRSYGSAGELRGKKLQLWEGGIRVPGIVRWPGTVDAGTVSSTPVSGIDLLPTLCSVAGIEIPDDVVLDGTDAAAAFEGETVEREVPLFWYHYKAWGGPRAVMRRGKWKIVGFWDGPERLRTDSATLRPGDHELIRTARLARFKLYDLEADPGEREDVGPRNPKIFEAMEAELIKMLEDVQADATMEWSESWLRRW